MNASRRGHASRPKTFVWISVFSLPTTLCQIAPNTKLFTAVAAGLLVEEGKLTWDKPVRESAPAIQFYDLDSLTRFGTKSWAGNLNDC